MKPVKDREERDANSKNREIILYLVFGVLTTCVSWGSYSLFVKTFGTSVAIGNTLSWIFATLFAFITNKIFVFLSKDWSAGIVTRELLSFVSARLGTGLFEVIAVPFLYNMGYKYSLFGIEGSASKITVSFMVVIANYYLSKKIVFKDKK